MATATKPVVKKGKKAKEPKEVKVPASLEEKFEAQLEAMGLGDALKLAEDYDNDVKVVSSGFPGLDRAIDDRGVNSGIPQHRHIEIYSKKEGAGKTSIALAIGLTWQEFGLRVGIIDIEPSVTKQYLRTLGYIVDKDIAIAQGKYAVRLLQPTVKPEQFETDMLYLEAILDIIASAGNVFDLLIIDSVDALVSELEAEKVTADNDQVGGIAKKMRAFFRKNTTKRATCLFLNHANVSLGKTMPGMPASFSTSGGKSVPRYSSLRLELTQIEKLAEKDKPPYGFVTRVLIVKNRLGPNWRIVDLFYIFGEGFSRKYDYFELALKMNIFLKSGSYLYIPGEGKNVEERKNNARWKCQGKLNTYRTLTDPEATDEDKAIWAEIVGLIDGVDADGDVLIGEAIPEIEALNNSTDEEEEAAEDAVEGEPVLEELIV